MALQRGALCDKSVAIASRPKQCGCPIHCIADEVVIARRDQHREDTTSDAQRILATVRLSSCPVQ
jgi:hypothetical protein